MNLIELKAELSVKMMEMERALDAGMSYAQLKQINNEIKRLQYELITIKCEETEHYDSVEQVPNT